MRKPIRTPSAPAAVGPYSQGVAAAGLIFVSGQIPLDPATGALVEGDIAAQTRRCLHNLVAVLEAAGSGAERLVRTTVWLVDMGDFAAVNAAYAEFFAADPPARVCVEVSRLPKGAHVEIDGIAVS